MKYSNSVSKITRCLPQTLTLGTALLFIGYAAFCYQQTHRFVVSKLCVQRDDQLCDLRHALKDFERFSLRSEETDSALTEAVQALSANQGIIGLSLREINGPFILADSDVSDYEQKTLNFTLHGRQFTATGFLRESAISAELFYLHGLEIGAALLSLLIFWILVRISTQAASRSLLEKEFEARQADEKQRHELNIARSIQQDLIPHDFVPFPERNAIDIFARLEGSKDVSGDFYDFFKLDNSHIFLAIGGINGTGIPAALMMVISKSLLRNAITKHRHCGYAMTVVSQEIARQRAPIPLSLFCAVVNIYTGKTSWAAAGNPLAAIVRHSDGAFERLLGDPIQVGENEQTVFAQSKIQLFPNDLLFLATDGIVNAHGKENIPFSLERVEELVTRHAAESAESVINTLYDQIEIHSMTPIPEDDRCTLAFRSRYIIAGNPSDFPSDAETIQLTNVLHDLEKLNAWTESLSPKYEIPMAFSMILNLVQEEWFVNIVSYAYTDKDLHNITVRAWKKESALWLQFEDDGIPYDPTARLEVDIDLPLEQRRIGGLGIHFIRQTMDIFHYQRRNNQNVVTFMKRLDTLPLS